MQEKINGSDPLVRLLVRVLTRNLRATTEQVTRLARELKDEGDATGGRPRRRTASCAAAPTTPTTSRKWKRKRADGHHGGSPTPPVPFAAPHRRSIDVILQ
ncbi:hypothetical protein HHL28_12725 [Aerophototrophica crusticola]|uniref:Uncharacterized protein n=1 Tax=Aerophototrophica crusticola TaxID=1709002 RepID=A0A858R8W4_9PROT|nr:hypothetical protein HHL28_12725 [Rhodospirillaceae bacterium B3]